MFMDVDVAQWWTFKTNPVAKSGWKVFINASLFRWGFSYNGVLNGYWISMRRSANFNRRIAFRLLISTLLDSSMCCNINFLGHCYDHTNIMLYYCIPTQQDLQGWKLSQAKTTLDFINSQNGSIFIWQYWVRVCLGVCF